MHVASPTKKVMALAEKLTGRLGGELPLLLDADLEEIKSVAGETIALAIKRMRLGEVNKEAGYDGKFGRVRVFKDNEQDMLFAKGLIDAPVRRKRTTLREKKTEAVPVRHVMQLNDEQLSAVEWEEGPIIVMAGPGTGKTRVLVERIRGLIDKGETSILAVTFTNRAAQEIRDRLDRSSGEGEGVEVSTFHSLAAGIMHNAGISFEIADEAMLEKIAAPTIGRDVKKWVDDLVFRQGTEKALASEQAALIELMRSQGLFTYEGLIVEAARLVSSGISTKRLTHVMADEFQDINPVQYSFLKILSKGAKSVMVIGDPNQAIYGFRGSSKASFEDFIQDSPECAKIHLSVTHRLGTHIACASNAFIGCDAVCSERETSPIRVVRTDRPYDFIAREIEALSGGLTQTSVGKAKGEYGLSDMAIIVRTRSQAMPVMEALALASIPHDTAYAGPFAAMRGIRERIVLLVGQDWEHSVKGVGEQALKCIQSELEPAGHVQDKIKQAGAFLEGLTGSVSARVMKIDASDLFKLPTLDANNSFYQYAQLFGDNVEHFVEFLKLSNDQSALGAEKVHVITAHAAKGLEFRCVFMAGLMRGVFPLTGSSLEEEQNLFYVGMTRAKDLLYLVCPQDFPSEFVGRIPAGNSEETKVKHKKPKPGQMVLFD